MIYRSAMFAVPPLLHVVTSTRELVVGIHPATDGDHPLVLARTHAPEIVTAASPGLVDAIRIVVAPSELAKSGAKVGVGGESVRLTWSEEPRFEVALHWRHAPGADPFAAAAQAARERLRLVYDLIRAVEGGATRLEPRTIPWLADVVRTRPPRTITPIRVRSELGQLAVRFRVTSGYQPSAEAVGTWYRIHDSGVVERRREADVDDDGRTDGTSQIPVERVARIAALALEPLHDFGEGVSFEWQVYGILGTRIAAYACSASAEMGGPGQSAALLYELSGLTYGIR